MRFIGLQILGLAYHPFKHKRVVFVTTRFVEFWEPSSECCASCPNLLGLLLFLLDFDHFTTFIESAIRTDGVRKAHRTAIGTSCEVMRL